MLDYKIGNISVRYCFILLNKFCNFVILSGLLSFVFGVDSRLHFADYDTLHFFIFVK